jgi:hypothetical protein
MTKEPLPLLVAVPPIAGAVAWLGVLIVSAVAAHPIWPMEAANLSEAAALRDAAAVVRRVDAGEDVNQAAQVRARLVLDEAAVLTPIEAAAGARDEALAELLFDLGATPDADIWNRAFCISDADRVRSVLLAHRPPGAVDECASP